jgi:carbonic anhydrase
MKKLPQLFAQNRAWSEEMKTGDPDFFNKLAHQQSPNYLWIGCSDSRVPSTQLVGLTAGDMFVHRNVANVVVHTDFNCLAALQYAVEVLKVEHVIVCGHYACGGVKAAMKNLQFGLIDNWLRHVQDVMHTYAKQLAAIEDETARVDRLCELNVLEQVVSVGRTTIVESAWNREQELTVHGWIYDVADGLLKDLGICVNNQKELTSVHNDALKEA